MSQEKEKLERAMLRIKSILQEEDIAAAIVLTTPDKQASHAKDFITIKYDHVDTSFSYAKPFKHHCCDKHGKVDGIMIHAELSKEPDLEVGVKKMQNTVGMFGALHKGAMRTVKMCEEVGDAIAKTLAKELERQNRKEDANYFMNKKNMN